jgi:dTDP-glucose 4,6-dehydratase
MKLLVTGGAGFIGSNFIRHVLREHADDRVVNLDKLTYAGNPANLADVQRDARYTFVHGDICDAALVRETLRGVDAVVNFAAESHVDRSLVEPDGFLRTDVFGVFTLLEAVRECRIPRFLHISTDEVYGSVAQGSSTEQDPLRPSNPYSASKASGDLLALSYWRTHGVPVVITRSSNNFGPYQYPEKVVPLFITNAIDDQPLPLYGDGRNVRDWLYVVDNCAAIDLVLRRGRDGEVYNIGGGHEVENVVLTHEILRLTGKPETLIRRVTDRPGHDRRYSVNSTKVGQLGWSPRHPFAAALETTVRWYREHESWWRPLKSGEFRAWYERQYANR